MAAGGRSTLAAARGEAPAPDAVPEGGVAAAEAAAAEVVRRVRPTEASERRRAEVVDYARRLFGGALGCEVFAFGSVPLKTYLPDGDVDLTVLGNASYDSTLVNDVYRILESEEQDSEADFEVKDLEQIDAEVRVIKCTVANITVDISFNQTGGICALCFLELVDRKVGKNHLFKKSIILIKAWCYYESRLLGANHGLISTYALEILILYIFNLFHKSLDGPLEVLYRFLEHFSKFDWDNYCLSLNGPVALSSLPNLIVEATVTHTDDLLFDKEFLKSSVDKAFAPLRNSDSCYMRFRPKHLNIIDPLKEYNNLGRSVNRASFHRIRTAFSYGAQKLGKILMLPSELIPDEIYGFFKNTLERNGRGLRPDIGSNCAVHSSFGTARTLLEDISSMKMSYNKEDENKTPRLLKSLGNNNSYVGVNGPTRLSSCDPGGHHVALHTDLNTWSSHFVRHAPKQYLLYQDNRDASSEKCYMHHETEQLSHWPVEVFHVADRSSIQSQVHVNYPSLRRNSCVGVNRLKPTTGKKIWSVVHAEKQHLAPSSLNLPDLSGDLDSQFKCLRQVQHHLEYLFDGFLQSVREASSDDKFHKDRFHIPAHGILLNWDAALARLLLPSAKCDGRKSSPVSFSDSTEDLSHNSQAEDPWDVACHQDVSLPSGTDVPSNGLSPSSSCADPDSSFGCHSTEDVPEMHGTDIDFPKKSFDTYKERLASSRENGKILANQPVRIESSQASIPGGSFVPYKEQVALDSRTREITIGQPLKVHGYVHSDRKIFEKHSCDTQKEFVGKNNGTRQIQKYHRDFCLNQNFLQNQCYDSNIEFARTPSALKQMREYQPFNIQNTTNGCASACLSNDFSRKQSYGTRIEHEILDWPTKHIPICESLDLQCRRHGRVCSMKNSAGKQNYNNHKVRGAMHIPCSYSVSMINGLGREVDSNKLNENGSQLRPRHILNGQEKPPISDTCRSAFPFAKGQPVETIEFGSLGPFALKFFSSKSNEAIDTLSASEMVLLKSRSGATQNRSPGFCKVVDEDEFPPLKAGVR